MWSLLGAHGYVGRHLTRELEASGEEVSPRGRGDGDFRVRVDPAWLAGARAVVLLAGATRTHDADLLLDNRRIVAAVLRALEELRRPRPPLLFVSSLHVYRPSARPVGVGDPTFPSRSLYGTVKRSCERRLADAARTLEFPLWIGRAGNLVSRAGPANPESFLGDMRRSLLANGRLEVRRAPVRDVVWIGDLALGLRRRLAELPPPGNLLLENVCTGRGLALRRVAEAARGLWEERGGRGEVVEVAKEDADVLIGVPPSDRLWGRGPEAGELAPLVVGTAGAEQA